MEMQLGYLKRTLVLILAGGSGSRLKSLTRWHSKPSVPFGGKFRTIDFALSNCINSGLRQICILTQYKSHSLNTHINKGWSFLRPELGEFVELLPAQQRVKDSWYMGTADAIYQNLDITDEIDPDYVLVLAGDHVYKMDYNRMIQEHLKQGADITVGCIQVPKASASEFGVMAIDADNNITDFQEKPQNPATMPGTEDQCLVSMGIYVFNRKFLRDELSRDANLDQSSHDFGRDIVPNALGQRKIIAFPFVADNQQPGYWRDVGTIDSYFDANMDLLAVTPNLNLYDRTWPIWTYQEQLPPAKFVFDDEDRRGMAVDSIVSGGCIVSGSYVRHSLLSNYVRVHSYSTIESSVLLPGVEVGRHCRIKNTIIDRNCLIPEGTEIGYDLAKDRERFYVSPNGVVLVSREMIDRNSNHVA